MPRLIPIDRQRETIERTGQRWCLSEIHRVRGKLLLERRPTDLAEVAPIKACMAAWEAVGGKCTNPMWKAFLAEAMALTGDLDNALQLLDKQIDQIECPGWEERKCYAEILRLKGWMLRGHGKFLGGLLLIVDGRLVSNR
jgi:hypothetical protein